MKKSYLISGIIIILIIILGFIYFNQERPVYFCGLGALGGPIEAMDPQTCHIANAKADKYIQLCTELVDETDIPWQEVCRWVLEYPPIICNQNIQETGLNISVDECLEKIRPLLVEDYGEETADEWINEVKEEEKK
ncbi:MAG: hypothetical protein ABII01_06655 [Candidatus Woesearchaeota archaeon]